MTDTPVLASYDKIERVSIIKVGIRKELFPF